MSRTRGFRWYDHTGNGTRDKPIGAPLKFDQHLTNISKLGDKPLFHRPTNLAPRSSLPCSRVRPGNTIGLFLRKLSNSGTSWKRCRKTRKLPSIAQGGRVLACWSPSRPTRMTPSWTCFGPGSGFLSKPIIEGFEMPSWKPKL